MTRDPVDAAEVNAANKSVPLFGTWRNAYIVVVVGQALAIWSAIIFLFSFAEVNKFSVWRSVGACLLPLLAFGICFGLFYFMAYLQ